MKNLILMLPILLCSCVSDLVSNLSEHHTGGCDEKLTGTWLYKFSGSRATWYLQSHTTNNCIIVDFRIIVVSAKTAEEEIKRSEIQMVATFTTIKDINFINLNIIKDGAIDPINYLFRYEWDSNGNLRTFLLNNDALKQAIRSGHIKGKIDGRFTINVTDKDNLIYIAKHSKRLLNNEVPLLRISDTVNDRPLSVFSQ